MLMKRINQLFGCMLLTFFLFMAYTSRTTLDYWTTIPVVGPGPGFFPFWISLILAGLTIYWMIQITIRTGEKTAQNFIPSRRGAMLVLVVLLNMVVCTLILDYTGFRFAMFVFLLAMMLTLGERTRRHVIHYVIFSVGYTAFFVIVFGRWLEVSFPRPFFGIFKAMGL